MKIPYFFLFRHNFVSSIDGIPVNLRGYKIDGYNKDFWMTGDKCVKLARIMGNRGCSFVIDEDDDYFVIDLDDVIVDGVLLDHARQICEDFSECYQEISKSGEGIHIIGKLKGKYNHRIKNNKLGIELYTKKKIVHITGNVFENRKNNLDHECDNIINKFIDDYQLHPVSETPLTYRWTETPSNDWSGSKNDDVLIAKALTNENFRKLWRSDEEFIRDTYADDHSSADAALCSHLAFWTGRNCERMERLFSRSQLGKREKWQNRDDYRKRTIINACATCKTVAKEKQGTIQNTDSKTPTYEHHSKDINENGRYASIEMQKELFKHCVYLWKSGLIFDSSRYQCLDKDAFNGLYNHYSYALDWDGEKYTKSAYEAFRESKAYIPLSCEDVLYEPNREYGEILEGLKYSGFPDSKFVNAFIIPEVDSKPGDTSRFDEFVDKLFPDRNDKKIILSYMASIVQNKGKKVRWCPVIQGTQGNGKTTLMRIVEQAIGHQVSSVQSAKKIFGDNFNGWLEGKLFVGIDELKKVHYKDNVDDLNDMVTNHRISIRKMYCDPTQRGNYTNFMICTNHKDAVEVNGDTRRWCIFYTAQQKHDDLVRDGLTKEYFTELNEWLEDEGFAIVTNYLQNFEIEDEYNPINHSRAPETSSTADATIDSLPTTVQKIKEAVDEGLQGFKNGFISSCAIAAVLGYKPTRWNEIAEGLDKLGYVKMTTRTKELLVSGLIPNVPGSPYSPGTKVRHSLYCLKKLNISDSNNISEIFVESQK